MKKTLTLFLGLTLTAIAFGQTLKTKTLTSPTYGKVTNIQALVQDSSIATIEIADYLGEVIFTDEFVSSYDKNFAFNLPKSVIDRGVVVILTSANGKKREKFVIK